MPTFLSDASFTLYVLLTILVIVLAALWLRKRKRSDLIRLLVGAGILTAVYLIDLFVESPREEATRKTQEMANSSQKFNWDEVMKHVSDSFSYKSQSGQDINKPLLLEKARALRNIPQFAGFAVWDFSRDDFKTIDDKNIQIGFRAQARDLPVTQSYVTARFTKDADGQWRLAGFARYDPAKQTNAPPLPINGID